MMFSIDQAGPRWLPLIEGYRATENLTTHHNLRNLQIVASSVAKLNFLGLPPSLTSCLPGPDSNQRPTG
jgi:hypothetical protein